MITWKYKDSKRYYWLIELEKFSEVTQGEDVHFEWAYTVSRSVSDDDWTQVDEGVFLGQFDEEPTLSNVLGEFIGYITQTALGMVIYSKREETNEGNS